MAVYETGTATDTTDLINKLITFATANGWTVNTPTSGKVFTKGGIYFGLNFDADDVWVCGATGYNAAAAWSAQPGASASQCRANDIAGPYVAYHFFTGTSPDYLHVVVEKTAGVFKHFVMGQLVKNGTFTGGEYVGAVYWHPTIVNVSTTPNHPDNAYHTCPFDAYCISTTATNKGAVRADIDAKSNNWMIFNDASSYDGNRAKGVVRGSNRGLLEVLHERSPSEFNQITPFLPIPVAVERPSSMVSPLGHVPDMRYVNMTNLTPGSTITFGVDEWMVFPLIQKTDTWDNASSSIPSSGTYGFAYRKN